MPPLEGLLVFAETVKNVKLRCVRSSPTRTAYRIAAAIRLDLSNPSLMPNISMSHAPNCLSRICQHRDDIQRLRPICTQLLVGSDHFFSERLPNQALIRGGHSIWARSTTTPHGRYYPFSSGRSSIFHRQKLFRRGLANVKRGPSDSLDGLHVTKQRAPVRFLANLSRTGLTAGNPRHSAQEP
jgi:hypothetical protein